MTQTAADPTLPSRILKRKQYYVAEIAITINGEARTVPEGMTIRQLIESLQMEPRYLAVERNQLLVPRGQHEQCVLLANDQIEIVTLVGGG